jgi:Cytochrome c3
MMRDFSLVLLCLLIGLSQAVVLRAVAQAPTGASHGFLINKHVAAGLTCTKCHTESTAKAPVMATCLSCHGGTYASLAAKTDKDHPNPHASHRGEVSCAECHHVHRASTTLCNQCHSYDMTTP